jgi:hypothetical protein
MPGRFPVAKPSALLRCLACVAVASISIAPANADEPKQAPSENGGGAAKPAADVFQDWGPAVYGQSVSITTDRSAYAPGERIILRMHLKNFTNDEVRALSWRNPHVYRLSVSLPDGKPAPLSLYGEKYFSERSSGVFGGELKPGQTRSLDVELSRLFDFSLEGKYAVSVERYVHTLKDRKDGSPATATSNRLEITVGESAHSGGESHVSTVSAENHGAAIDLSIPRSCKLGQPMPLSITIRNEGDKPFFCDEAAGLPNQRMEMKLEGAHSNAAVQMTPSGKIRIESLRRGGAPASVAKLDGRHERTWTVDLDDFFQLAGGNYRFAVAFQLRDEQGHYFKVVADNLLFEVSE